MPLTLYVDTAAWQEHLRAEMASDPGLVPVVKGNGYGFTVPLLIRTAADLGAPRIAVGTCGDAAVAVRTFPGDVIVLQMCAETDRPVPDTGRRVLYTAGSVQAAARLAGHRLIVDCRTSLGRQGITEADLAGLGRVTDGGRAIEAFSLHLPIDRPAGTDPVAQTAHWVSALMAACYQVPTMYVSHLESAEVAALAAAFPGTEFRQRIGTRLWLGERSALRAAATVLQVTPVRRGERFGYRQHRSRRYGWLVTVAGGTAHGVGLEASRAPRGLKAEARILARAGLAAAGRVRSPFIWAGHKLWFAESPHMLVSMLLLPGGRQPPEPGAEVEAELGYTMTRFDRICPPACRWPAEAHRRSHAEVRWPQGRLSVLSSADIISDPPIKPSAAVSVQRRPLSGVFAVPLEEDARAV
ncbi:MAG TPA: alanine racemase [Streptosporangiaceae bacterium]|jgi:hypothetical protein